MKKIRTLFVNSYKAWINDNAFTQSASVAYYAIISLPALMIILLNVLAVVFDEKNIQQELINEIAYSIGRDSADMIKDILEDKGDEDTSLLSTITGIAILIYGATGVFFQIQNALDKIWDSKSSYANNVFKMIVLRAKSFGFILVIGFLILISSMLTSMLTVLAKYLMRILPDNMIDLAYLVDVFISLIAVYFLFAIMFKFLPNTKVRWKAVRLGAAITSITFLLGKYGLASYFNGIEPASSYGAAGSIILIMLWVFYTCLILFFGAQFTRQYNDLYLDEKKVKN